MAQDTSGAAAPGGGTLVIPGEMAARVDRLPKSLMAWEICLIVQVGWATAAATDGIAARLYPFIWLPAKVITHSQYIIDRRYGRWPAEATKCREWRLPVGRVLSPPARSLGRSSLERRRTGRGS